jgi:tetratricopeptide (TPR) repeat protein
MRNNGEQPKNKNIASLLSMVGGFIGIHKLYLKDTSGFIFFIILFMMSLNVFGFPLTFLLGLFQALQLRNMSQQEFDSKYNGGYVQRGDSRIEKRREEQMRRHEVEDTSKGYRQAAEPIRQRANPFKSSGVAKYKEFDLDGAIEDFKKGIDIDPNDVALNYNLACAYSLSENKDEAYKFLAKAVSLGFNDFERIQTHDDLAFVRIQPEFDTFKQSGYRIYTGAKKAPVASSSGTSSQVQEEQPIMDEGLLEQLKRLAELKDRGILTEQEFALEKRKLTRREG